MAETGFPTKLTSEFFVSRSAFLGLDDTKEEINSSLFSVSCFAFLRLDDTKEEIINSSSFFVSRSSFRRFLDFSISNQKQRI